MALGSPTVKSKALEHHTPDGEHLCACKFQEGGSPDSRCELWPDSVPKHSRYALSTALGSLRSEISSLSGWLPQQRNVGLQRPATIERQRPRCLPYSLLFWLCFGRKEGARALSRAAWSWDLIGVCGASIGAIPGDRVQLHRPRGRGTLSYSIQFWAQEQSLPHV